MTASADTPPRPPRLIPGSLYSRQDIIANLRISKGTLSKWNHLADPLLPIELGTNAHFYLADDVIRFFISHRDLKNASEE